MTGQRLDQGLTRGPHDCPVARPGQSWAWPRPWLAWPRPQAHACAQAEAPHAHMGVAGPVSGSLAARGVAEMTFFTKSFYFSTKPAHVIAPKFNLGFLGPNPTSGRKFRVRNYFLRFSEGFNFGK